MKRTKRGKSVIRRRRLAGPNAPRPNNESVLIPDPKVRRMLNISPPTLWRWTHNPAMGFPPRVQINGRNYRNAVRLSAWIDARQ
jgi:hypothetical protein